MKNYIIKFKERLSSVFNINLVEEIAFIFIILAGASVYYYAIFEIVPIVLKDCPCWKTLIYVFGTWVLAAVYLNLTLIRTRHSTIRSKLLLEPTVTIPEEELNALKEASVDESGEAIVRKRTKFLGEQMTANPFGNSDNWHICSVCEVMVPPRAWHCPKCDICILRRDHHCVFTKNCIGEANHCNFLGFVFYIAVGTTVTAGLSFYYGLYVMKNTIWAWLFKVLVPFFVVLFDFSYFGLFSALSFLGMLSAWGVFIGYMWLASRGVTSSENRKLAPEEKIHSYVKLRELLGPYPFWRILWPLHAPLETSLKPKSK